MPDNYDLVTQNEQENKYRLEIYELLQSKGWRKLSLDSLWVHPDKGILHVLFALYLTLKPEKRNKLALWLSLISLVIGICSMVVVLV